MAVSPFIRVIVIVPLLNLVLSSQYIEFNCLRHDVGVCGANGRCSSSGDCVCDSGFEGYDCSVDSSTAHDCPGCQNSTRCLGSGECLCSPKYYGPTCQFQTLDMLCSKENIVTLIVNLPRVNDLHAGYIEGTSRSECTIRGDYSEIDPDRAGKYLDILLDSTICGTFEYDIENNHRLCATLVFQYFAGIETAHDFKANICCESATKISVSAIAVVVKQPTTTTPKPSFSPSVHRDDIMLPMPMLLTAMILSN